jgi:multidrug resistance efflux pump
MMRRRYTIPLIALLAILALITTGCETLSQDTEQALEASGIVEVTEVSVSSEVGGQVVEVLVQNGELVEAEQVLIRFDEGDLLTQLDQAEAALAQAQANYDLIAAGPSTEQRAVAIASAELELVNAQQALDDLYENADLLAAQALHDIAAADKALDKANKHLKNIKTDPKEADVNAAWARVVMAKDRLEDAQKDFRKYENKSEENVTRAHFLNQLAEAQKQYDATVTRYNNIKGTANRYDLALAEADVALVQAQLDNAHIQYEKVASGPDPDQLALVEARLATAEANLAFAKADPSPEELAAAQAQVDVAEAALRAIQSQMDKLILVSPIDGIVLSRLVEPGEVVAPGVPLITLGSLDDLTITVYIPENQYGAINLGQKALVTVDSFPRETFEANVVRIADQAEFTPRNVQTQEERQTTVYAVKLSVDDPQGKLKPGMPADVVFVD